MLTKNMIWGRIQGMKRFVFWMRLTLVVLMLLFIWGNSMLPGNMSNMESGFVLRLIRPVVSALQRLMAALGNSCSQEYLVRKLAHFGEFMVLGVLMVILFLREDGHCRFLLPAALCLAVALVDEGIQILSQNRGPSLKDVSLDFCGACAGLLLTAAVLAVVRQIVLRRRRTSQ